ncbi:MAG: hypothetical protein K6A28_09260 [Bacteroidales bacterium]|nr:hypothetical protein [Bacteroidales bacterium]
MKTKKFLMTTLLVMGMIIAKAANGFPPELVLVSQPVLTYNTNSVTIYYDVQNIGDFTYRGDIYIYLDPDDGYYYAKKYVRVCPGRIKRIAISIPAYRPNPTWVYTVMPYYELGNELYSFTTFEYFEPLSFCWYGYRDEPWVVIHVGPRPHYYHRPSPYRYYYDGYYPMLPPPPGGYSAAYYAGLTPLNPMHHTYGYHHHYGGYPASYHPTTVTPGYNHIGDSNAPATVVRPSGANTAGSMSSRVNGSNGNNSATVNRPSNSGNASGATGRTDNNSSVSRPSSSSSNSSGRTDNNSSVSRPSSSSNNNPGRTDNNSSVSRPSSSSNNNPGRTNNSGSVSRPSSSSNTSGRSGNSNSRSNGNSRSDNSRGSSSSRGNGGPSRGR